MKFLPVGTLRTSGLSGRAKTGVTLRYECGEIGLLKI